MKLFVLAAAALAAPAMAFAMPQDTTPAQTDPAAPTAATPAQSDPAAPAASTPAPAAPTGTPTADPVGGYQPATAPTGANGGPVQFQPSADPNTAYPPPAPMTHYPPCRAGQTDHCMERGSRR